MIEGWGWGLGAGGWQRGLGWGVVGLSGLLLGLVLGSGEEGPGFGVASSLTPTPITQPGRLISTFRFTGHLAPYLSFVSLLE